MAHKEQRDFCLKVKEKLPQFFKNKKVLDIGSLDINGSNRDLFDNCNYIGIDVGEGKNVDFISVGHLYDGPDNYFDTIISTEVFEHDMFYDKTITNIMRMLKPGGLFLFTCAAPGRPEHGTRRQGDWCAPLLLNISEQWADYYKNLTEDDIKTISNFKETFIDGHFELNNIYLEIPADLYFYGVKGGEKYLVDNINPKYISSDYNDDIFVVDCWPSNESKENDLVNLIKFLKLYNIPILLSGHYPVKPEIQKMVDYYLFDKNNPILLNHEFNEHGVSSGRWTKMSDHSILNENEFHHDYAIWETMRNTFNFCKSLNKKTIHFFEYDNIPNELQYRQSFLEPSRYRDAVIYEYTKESVKDKHFDPYCATFIFSIKTDVGIKMIDLIRSRKEYFTNKPKGWQLERVFLDCLKKVTNDIHISEYIANNDELNTQAVWDRDGVIRNGGKFQIYLAVDDSNNLYTHLISGFHEVPANKDYLIEINYNDYKKFIALKKDEFKTELIGKYKKGDRVKVYYVGNEVYSEFLGDDAEIFRNKNKLTRNNNKKTINVHFNDGPFVEVIEDGNNEYNIQFINTKNDKIEYETNIKSNHWSKCSIVYCVDWLIKIRGVDNNFYEEHRFNPENKRVYISLETRSLGDSLAWIPYVEEFRKVRKAEVVCSTFNNNLFRKQYPEIKFIEPGVLADHLYGLFRVGMFYKGNMIEYNKHPLDPKKQPLLKVASDILGLEYREIKPILKNIVTQKKKMVSIATHSTAQCKYWNNPTGWQDVVNFLNSKGYEVRLLSNEESGYMGNRNPRGVVQQQQSTLTDIKKVIQESELFIGISSGLSWLAWATGTPTILISGFTDKFTEPTEGVVRINNENVCHGCWSTHEFDRGNWTWCPIHENTDRQFECSKQISSEQVINEIKKTLSIE